MVLFTINWRENDFAGSYCKSDLKMKIQTLIAEMLDSMSSLYSYYRIESKIKINNLSLSNTFGFMTLCITLLHKSLPIYAIGLFLEKIVYIRPK